MGVMKMGDELLKDLNSMGCISNRAKLAKLLTDLGYVKVVRCVKCVHWERGACQFKAEYQYCSEGELNREAWE